MSEYVKNKPETYVSRWIIQINGDKNTENALHILASKEKIK